MTAIPSRSMVTEMALGGRFLDITAGGLPISARRPPLCECSTSPQAQSESHGGPRGRRPRPRLAPVVAAFALAVLLASCGSIETGRVVTRTDLMGTWTDHDGGSMTFRADQNVTVHRLDVTDMSDSGGKSCGFVSGSGTWQFDSNEGVSGPTPTSYTASTFLEIDLSQPVSELCGALSYVSAPSASLLTSSSPLELCLYLGGNVCDGPGSVRVGAREG